MTFAAMPDAMSFLIMPAMFGLLDGRLVCRCPNEHHLNHVPA
jgi:hypothetical protein